MIWWDSETRRGRGREEGRCGQARLCRVSKPESGGKLQTSPRVKAPWPDHFEGTPWLPCGEQ